MDSNGEGHSLLREQFDTLRERWLLVAGSVIAVALLAFLWSKTQPRLYQGTASVVVDRGASSFSIVPDLSGDQVTFLDTLAEIVRSRAVVERAAQRLGGDSPAQARAAREIRDGLRTARTKGTDVMRIFATGPSPDQASAYANAVTDALLAWHLDSRRSAATASRHFIESTLQSVGRELRQAEDALARYKMTSGQVALDAQTTAALSQISNFESQLRAASAERQAVERSILASRGQAQQQAIWITPSITQSEDPVVAQYRSKLAQLEVTLAELREQYTEAHPQVVATLAQINEVKTKLAQLAAMRVASETRTLNPLRQTLVANIIGLDVQREALAAREAALSGILQRYDRELRTLPPKEVQLARLTRDMQVSQGTYLLLQQKLQDARVAEASIVGDLRIVDPAQPSRTPVSPRTFLNTLLGALAGLLVGVGAAYTLDTLDTTFKTPEAAAAALGLPLLATVPAYRQIRGQDNKLMHLADPTKRRSPFAEAFRHLRTSLQYVNPDRPLQSVLVTSAGPDEGKSTVSANLAVVFTQIGQKVWLLECDLRKPSLSWTFQPKLPFGLSDLLVDGLPLDQALNQTAIENLWFVAGGTTPPNPAELLGSQRMRSLIEDSRDRSKVIVLDAPPVLPVTDAVVLSRTVDGVVFVLHLTKTPRDAARRAVRQLAGVGARVVGLVVNGVPASRRGGYHYYYSHYFDDEKDKEPAAKSSSPSTLEGSRRSAGETTRPGR